MCALLHLSLSSTWNQKSYLNHLSRQKNHPREDSWALEIGCWLFGQCLAQAQTQPLNTPQITPRSCLDVSTEQGPLQVSSLDICLILYNHFISSRVQGIAVLCGPWHLSKHNTHHEPQVLVGFICSVNWSLDSLYKVALLPTVIQLFTFHADPSFPQSVLWEQTGFSISLLLFGWAKSALLVSGTRNYLGWKRPSVSPSPATYRVPSLNQVS